MSDKRVTRTFEKQTLFNMGLPWTLPNGKIISDEQTDKSRWVSHHYIIFQLPEQIGSDEAWGVGYSQGLTEMQEEGPWEYENNVEAVLLHKKEKVVEVWE